MKTLLAALLAALVCASAGAAVSGQNVDLLGTFKQQVASMKAKTSVPILLPSRLAVLDKHKVYAASRAGKSTWDLELDFAPNCGTATACYLASFQGTRGGKLPGMANAKLASGDAAWYHPSTCGASCAPASLYFVHNGVLYSFQDSDLTVKSAKAFMLALANDAVAAGPR
jgi:hypothetical protein